MLYVAEYSLSSTQLALFYPHSAIILARIHSPRFIFTFQAFRVWKIRFHTHKVINTRYIMFCISKKCLFLNRHLHISRLNPPTSSPAKQHNTTYPSPALSSASLLLLLWWKMMMLINNSNINIALYSDSDHS